MANNIKSAHLFISMVHTVKSWLRGMMRGVRGQRSLVHCQHLRSGHRFTTNLRDTQQCTSLSYINNHTANSTSNSVDTSENQALNTNTTPKEGNILHSQASTLLSLTAPAFHTASDKSWVWRPGNEATSVLGSLLKIRQMLQHHSKLLLSTYSVFCWHVHCMQHGVCTSTAIRGAYLSSVSQKRSMEALSKCLFVLLI